MTCQCGFIYYNKCSILVGDVDSWGGCVYGGAGKGEASA